MALARDLVGLEARIRERAEVDLFLPLSASGLLAVPECTSILECIRSSDPASVMRLCLQSTSDPIRRVAPTAARRRVGCDAATRNARNRATDRACR